MSYLLVFSAVMQDYDTIWEKVVYNQGQNGEKVFMG